MARAEEAAPALREALKARHIAVRRLDPVRPTLEDAFISLIRQEDKA